MTGPEFVRAVAAQTATELTLTLRRGESLLVTVIIPTVLLVFFASARVLPGNGQAIDFLLPGTLALAVISTGLVSLGIATAYERHYGVLKRFGATPFPRVGLIVAKLLSVAALEAAQVLLLIVIAAAFFGWRPHGSVPLAVLFLMLGTITFAGLGLAMAGGLRVEATLAGANGLFLFFLLLGGLFVPLDHLPSWLADIAPYLPAAALADLFRSSLTTGGHLAATSLLVLFAWSIGAPLLAATVFRWE